MKRREERYKIPVEPYDEKDCKHEIFGDTSLKFVSIRTFEYPPRKYAICLNCRKSFTFVEIEPGKYVTEDEYNNNNN